MQQRRVHLSNGDGLCDVETDVSRVIWNSNLKILAQTLLSQPYQYSVLM